MDTSGGLKIGDLSSGGLRSGDCPVVNYSSTILWWVNGLEVSDE